MHIHISIQRPWATVGSIALIALFVLGSPLNSAPPHADATGGEVEGEHLHEALGDVDRERIRQAVLEHREEILRYQLMELEKEAIELKTPEALRQLAVHRSVLLALIEERSHSEELMRSSLEQIWEAQGTDFLLETPGDGDIFQWPVIPKYGISAYFKDAAYKKRFHGLEHHAIDIPTEQGTPIVAPADGTVAKVADNGLGYSYVTLEHSGGLQTTFGHVSSITVTEGQQMLSGQVIAYSGGRPGSQGAGLLTTGPHLHFAVRYEGKLVDPLKYLVKTVKN